MNSIKRNEMQPIYLVPKQENKQTHCVITTVQQGKAGHMAQFVTKWPKTQAVRIFLIWDL